MILLNGSNIKKMFLDETLFLTVYRLMLTVTIKSVLSV